MVTACSIIARNYLAHARVLAASFFAHHPQGSFTLLLIDDEARQFSGVDESFRCLRLSDIGLDSSQIGQLAAIYDVTELATAVKPRFLRHLLGEGASDVIYLDPDIKIYGPLDEASRLARQHGIVLTPHTTVPFVRDGKWVDDFHILAAGVYNLGFIAVGSGAEPFIDWWWERTQREARIDPTQMMFTDQRWVDFVPSFYQHVILKDPTYNVAYWNLHGRDLSWNGTGYLVDGKPLTFFHFSGFDGRRPHLLSKHQGERPRILLSERPALARICRDYLTSLVGAGLSRESTLPYGWHTLPSGLSFDRQMRRLYREALDLHANDRGAEPPNPFDAGGEERFLEWLGEPVAIGLLVTLSRYLHAIYQDRIDLQRAFPDLAGADGPRYLEWIRGDGVVQHKIPTSLLPPPVAEADDGLHAYVAASRLSEGVNIAGYFRAELGVGEAARLLTSAIEAATIPHATVTYDATLSRKAYPFAERGDRRAPYDVNILCVNADQTPTFAKAAGPRFFEGRYTAGYWFWELDRLPPAMHQAFDYVDEVWTATRFVASGIQAIGRRPVHTVPLPVPIPRRSETVTRGSFHLPDGFLFLFAFDLFSVFERKNPLGLVRAFARAFRSGEGPTLVIKTINGDRKLHDLEKLRAATEGRPDILVIDEYYSAEEKNSLLGLCDCYVSLHRSEGLGLTMAEAMGLEKPVIATGYSGNLDFMTAENSYLVDYTMGAVPAGSDPYPEGSPWAEPNLDHAAELMRRVYDTPKDAARKAAQARQDILTKHNVAAAAVSLKRRLDEIRQARGRVTAGAATAFAERSVKAAPAESSVALTLDRAATLLTPTSSVAPGRRFSGLLLSLQNTLFRVLRPYWWQQRQLQGLLIESVREVSQEFGRAVRSEPHQRQALESVWNAVHALGAASQEDREWLGQIDQATREMQESVDSSVAFRASVGDQLEKLTEQVAATTAQTTALAAHFASMAASVESFQTSAAAHLKALTDQLAATTAEASNLSHRLYAAPYMHQPERFYYSTETGKRVLGFRGRRNTSSDLYAGFEDVFRGSESFIRERLRIYLPLLKDYDNVVEIGCGRGELLNLLTEAGVHAFGVDLDDGMVHRCRTKGHNVVQMDGLAYLREQADDSMPAIFAAQVVEHLAYDDLMAFLELSRAKLKPGGRLIFETVNPHALEAFKTFWTDLTHQRPIFPEVALTWCWLVGFERAHVLFPNGVNDLDRDLTTQGEYGIVATKASSE